MCVSIGSLTKTKDGAGSSGDRRRRGRGTRGSHVGRCAVCALALDSLRSGWADSCCIWSGYAPWMACRPASSRWVETLTFPLLRVLLFSLALRNLSVLARLLLTLVHIDEVLASGCQLKSTRTIAHCRLSIASSIRISFAFARSRIWYGGDRFASRGSLSSILGV